MSFSSACRRVAAVTAGALAVTVGLALPALAHVTINPGTAEKGGFAKVAFRVPNERDKDSTTKLEIELPADHPLPFVSVRPVPGWTAKVTETTLPKPVPSKYGDIKKAVTKITWSGGKIEPGQFQEFEVSMGFLPEDTDQLAFPTTQTYSGGEVVKWADAPKADGSEAEHPTPLLKLVAPAAGGEGHGSGGDDHGASAAPSPAVTVTAQAAASPSGSDGTARLLAGIGIVAGVAGVATGVAGLRRGRGASGN
ncbi:YcnI family copper-binding membrane protein [Sphaerisporangium fuscum]|uniref:YcnI family copper-binding membrane protein n=1 Tax=Sphaerisporangium fuscum TaxID=2835868 RepID=UPI001BDDB44A|nr:YcnI family protein [Sphaerisporangium fuscum]